MFCMCLSCEAGIPTGEILISLPAEFPLEPKPGCRRRAHVCKINESILPVHCCTWKALWPPTVGPGLGRSPGGGLSSPLQHSCLENPMDGGARQATAVVSQRVGHDEHTYITELTLLKRCVEVLTPRTCEHESLQM